MSEIAVRVEDLGKSFFLSHRPSGDLRKTLTDGLKRIFTRGPGREEFWALKNLNLEIRQGDIVGIIGRNGAGKSTLLKILSRITEPTTGRFEINGRVSSLLEVGTGFHGELTGRENIFLNGTILGMRRAEIKSRFDEIVCFSGIENFLDTPVKHYSSGMRVRLAFSVAAHLEPDILIIDEVLAVGDAEFQRKCLGKMDEVSKRDGRTILFVSHNLAAVRQLCNKGFLLREGHVAVEGSVNAVIQSYLSQNKNQMRNGVLGNLELRKGNGLFRVASITLADSSFLPVAIIHAGSTVNFIVRFDKTIRRREGFRIDFALDNEHDVRIGWFSSEAIASELSKEFDEVIFRIPKFPYGGGRYYLTFYATINHEVVDYLHQGFCFDVEDGDFFGTGRIIPRKQTFFYVEHEIESR